MNWTPPPMREPHSKRRCLAISAGFLLLAALSGAAQDEYVYGYGKSPQEAIGDIAKSFVLVATHSRYGTGTQGTDYHGVTGVSGAVILPREGIELSQEDGRWVARVRKDLVTPVEGTWKEESITVNNTYHEVPTFSRGFKRTRSTRVTTRERVVRDPAGRVVDVAPGKTHRETTLRCWNGRYGYTYTRTETH